MTYTVKNSNNKPYEGFIAASGPDALYTTTGFPSFCLDQNPIQNLKHLGGEIYWLGTSQAENVAPTNFDGLLDQVPTFDQIGISAKGSNFPGKGQSQVYSILSELIQKGHQNSTYVSLAISKVNLEVVDNSNQSYQGTFLICTMAANLAKASNNTSNQNDGHAERVALTGIAQFLRKTKKNDSDKKGSHVKEFYTLLGQIFKDQIIKEVQIKDIESYVGVVGVDSKNHTPAGNGMPCPSCQKTVPATYMYMLDQAGLDINTTNWHFSLNGADFATVLTSQKK